MTATLVEHATQRFLSWKLPANFNPDAGISFDPVANLGTEHQYRREPTGTNLFDYTQAKGMVCHILARAPLPDQAWPADAQYELGALVQKKGRASWRGKIVGWYRTDLTALGFAVESSFEPGSVQIYPQSALEEWDGLRHALEG